MYSTDCNFLLLKELVTVGNALPCKILAYEYFSVFADTPEASPALESKDENCWKSAVADSELVAVPFIRKFGNV